MRKFNSIFDVYHYLKECNFACVECSVNSTRRTLTLHSFTPFHTSLVRLFGDLLSANDDLHIIIQGDFNGVNALIWFSDYDED